MNSKYLVIDKDNDRVLGGADTLTEAYECAERILTKGCKTHGGMANVLVTEVVYDMHIHTSIICELRRGCRDGRKYARTC